MFIKLRAKGRNNSQHCWPNNHESCCVRLHWLNVWPVSKSAQHLPTTRNNMHRGVKKKATCNIQLCRELVASKMSDVGPVCTGLYMCKCYFFWLCTRCILTLFYHTLQLFVSPSKTYKKNNWRLPNFFWKFYSSYLRKQDSTIVFHSVVFCMTEQGTIWLSTWQTHPTTQIRLVLSEILVANSLVFCFQLEEKNHRILLVFFLVDSTLLACVARAYGRGKKKHVHNRNPNKLRQRKFISVQLPCHQMNLFNFHTVGDICSKTKWSLMNVILKYLTVQLHSVHWFLRKGTDPIAATAHTVPCFRVTFSLLQFFSPSSGCCPGTRSVIRVAHKSLSIFWRLQQ